MRSGELNLIFLKWIARKLRHFFDGYICVQEVISKLFIILFCISMSLTLFSKSLEFITWGADCAELGGWYWSYGASYFVCEWGGALPMLEIMGCRGVFGLWILGKPYNVGIVVQWGTSEFLNFYFFYLFFVFFLRVFWNKCLWW